MIHSIVTIVTMLMSMLTSIGSHSNYSIFNSLKCFASVNNIFVKHFLHPYGPPTQ
jgi:hypothetical protein